MGQSTQEVRQEIEQTRAEMGGTIDAIADRTSPGRIVDRQRQRWGQRMGRMRDSVMGTTSETYGSAAEGVKEAPEALRRGAQGNPMAAGLVAFGGGLLAASLLPPTRVEGRVAGRVMDEAQPAVDELRRAGEQLGEDVKESAGQAADEVRTTASESARTVSEEASSSS